MPSRLCRWLDIERAPRGRVTSSSTRSALKSGARSSQMVVLPSRGDLVAQGGRQRVDQAALDAGGRDHELALAAHQLAVGAARLDRDRDQRLARVAAAEMLAPVDVEAAVGRRQRRHRRPLCLAAAAPRRRPIRAAPSCRRPAPGSPHRPATSQLAVRRGERQRVAAAIPASGGACGTARRFAQAVQPGAQQRRRLHIGREHAARSCRRRCRCRGRGSIRAPPRVELPPAMSPTCAARPP